MRKTEGSSPPVTATAEIPGTSSARKCSPAEPKAAAACSTSAAMTKRSSGPVPRNVVGETFNYLTVKREFRGEDERSRPMLECDCQCGKTHTAVKSAIITGRTKSCGCFGRTRPRIPGNYTSAASRQAQEWRTQPTPPYRNNFKRNEPARRQAGVLDKGSDSQGTGLLGSGESVRPSSD